MGKRQRHVSIIDDQEANNGASHSTLMHEQIVRILGHEGSFLRGRYPTFLPFCPGDTTVGTETELQAAVKGHRSAVDLPRFIENSNYYTNMVKRAISGDMPKRVVSELEKYLISNTENVWENSFVRFKRSCLNGFADAVFFRDTLADKKNRFGGNRSDIHKFIVHEKGEEYIRVPVSYLLKIALADLIGNEEKMPRMIRRSGYAVMNCFTNDNTSPETHSFHIVVTDDKRPIEDSIAAETSRRFLLTQLLLHYANHKFGLKEEDQEAMAYFSPHPPVRQKKLNECISDAFYRELFMNPCLSGWDDGESKHRYMHLCHEVLSRSQLNAVLKLKEAGILFNNLALLPRVSSTGLSNNGLHLSLGSIRLKELIEDRSSGFTGRHEKYAADLAVKIIEHFLPLFVGTYTAAPHRIDFSDFHPEKVLGYLPHELDYTHLRMFWRRWKKKARINVLGNSVTPFGPPWLDKLCGQLFGLRGDYLPDNRLLNYLVCLMSTETSPALNGLQGNTINLKRDLSDLGIFHKDMSVYLLYKPREHRAMGFSGFEGRFYSLFDSFTDDLGYAAALQNVITALAYKYILEKKVTHRHIPDQPFAESERRQPIFCAAAGIPTFFVRIDSENIFIKSLLAEIPGTRPSRRYPGYLRVKLADYRMALLRRVRSDGMSIIEMFGIEKIIDDLYGRIEGGSEVTAHAKLSRGVMAAAGIKSQFDVNGDEYNLACEAYYRGKLLSRHLSEAFDLFCRDLRRIIGGTCGVWSPINEALNYVTGGVSVSECLGRLRTSVDRGTMGREEIRQLAYIILIAEYAEQYYQRKERRRDGDSTPIYRAGNT